jgi:hypothetical protein
MNLTEKYLSKSLLCYLIEKSRPQHEEETTKQIEECLRFLYLSHFTKGAIPVSQFVDNIWHLLILQTQEYFRLCESLPAKKYIHHSSNVYIKAEEQFSNQISFTETPAEEAKRQLEWLVSYIENFGELNIESLQYWSFANALCLKFNLTLESFNLQLRSLSSNKI